jgi:hypothetical protein
MFLSLKLSLIIQNSLTQRFCAVTCVNNLEKELEVSQKRLKTDFLQDETKRNILEPI